MLQREKGNLAKLLHIPATAFGADQLFSLKHLCGYDIPSFYAFCSAVMMRTALVTVDTWKQEVFSLRHHAPNFNHDTQLSSLPHVLGKFFTPPFWDSPPLALNLAVAAEGYTAAPPLSSHPP